jgi:hypothetical protein
MCECEPPGRVTLEASGDKVLAAGTAALLHSNAPGTALA